MARYNDSSDNNVAVSASNVIYGYYIKKDTLGKLMLQAFLNTPNASADKVRVFIDLNSIIRSIAYSNCIVYSNYEVACAIINMVAHYKSFFIKRNYGIQPEFYLVYSEDYVGSIENKRNPNYCNDSRCTIYNPNSFGRFNVLSQNITMVKLLVQYIPDVYFISTKMICSPVKVFNLIESFGDNIPNIVISKDPTMNQLPTISNTVIFRPKKTKTGNAENPSYDTSYIVNALNSVVDSLDNKNLSETTIHKIASLPPTYWSLIVAFNGMKYSSLERVFDIRNSIETINNNITNIGPIPTTNCIDNIQIDSKITGREDNRGPIRILHRNFDSIDIPYKNAIYKASAEAQIGIPPTLFDNNGLKSINDTYFNSKGLFIDLMTLL